MTIPMPITKISRKYSLPSFEECREMDKLHMYYYHFVLFYQILVWHNRKINLLHKVNKLLNY